MLTSDDRRKLSKRNVQLILSLLDKGVGGEDLMDWAIHAFRSRSYRSEEGILGLLHHVDKMSKEQANRLIQSTKIEKFIDSVLIGITELNFKALKALRRLFKKVGWDWPLELATKTLQAKHDPFELEFDPTWGHITRSR